MMKKQTIAGMLSAVLLLASVTGCGEGGSKEAPAYKWSNVAIGGGGYVTGMVYNETEENLVYARTDIGGAYRWVEAEQRWVAITDHLGADNWNLIGIESIATDPVEPNRVYVMGGTYMGDNGAVLVSEDYGTTWTQVDLPFGCGGNCSGRGVGERMMVNPNNNKEIYMGTRTEGLWKSEDFGKTWNPVESFPTKGTYFQESNSIGVMWVEFEPNSGDVYVGVAELNGQCVYRSSDQGATWEALPAFQQGLYPLQADFSADGTLYLSYADNCGPNMSQSAAGAVAKFKDGAFTDITPNLDDGRYGGFSGLSVDKNDPNTVVVSTIFYWSNYGDNIYRTTDGGETWTGMHNTKTGEKNYVMDVSRADWLTWGLEEAKLGWWTSDININPFNSDEVMYGTGATIYTTQNMTALGSGTPVTVAFDAYGLEETAVFQMASPHYQDGEPQLYSIMGDLTGFSHLDVTVGPDEAHFMGAASGGAAMDLDVAYENANCAVYTIEDRNKPIWYTRDGGATWSELQAPELAAGGKVSISADGSTMLWTPATAGNTNIYLYNFNDAKWFYAQGLGYGAEVAADRVNPSKYYAVYNGMFFRSTDGGQSFQQTGQMVSDNAKVYTVVGQEDHIWLCSGTMLMHSTDGGQNFEMLKGINFGAIGFGAPEKEGDYPVIYAIGTVGEEADQQEGIYRSTNQGKSWQRINDEQHLFGNLSPKYITGDGNVYGRVYFASNGRGIVMGDIAE